MRSRVVTVRCLRLAISRLAISTEGERSSFRQGATDLFQNGVARDWLLAFARRRRMRCCVKLAVGAVINDVVRFWLLSIV